MQIMALVVVESLLIFSDILLLVCILSLPYPLPLPIILHPLIQPRHYLIALLIILLIHLIDQINEIQSVLRLDLVDFVVQISHFVVEYVL